MLKYNFNKKYLDIKRFDVLKNGCIITNSNNGFYFDLDKINIEPLLWFYDENLIWIKDNNWQNFIYDTNSKILTKNKLVPYIGSISKDFLLVFHDGITVYNKNSNQIVSKLDTDIDSFKFSFFHNKTVLITTETAILTFSIQEGYLKWSKIDLEVEKTIGISQNQLLVGLKSGLLIALDIDTGAQLWQTQENVPIQNLRLSESEGILYGLQLHKFVTINAQNGALLVSKAVSYTHLTLPTTSRV